MINNLHLILDFEKLYSSISSLVYKNRWSKQKDVNYSYCHISRTWCKRHQKGASLVRQWIRIHLPMQETQFPFLVQEDTTCHGVTGSVYHNYWAWALGTISHNYRACTLELLKPTCPGAHALQQWEACTTQQRVAAICHNWSKPVQQLRPSAAKINIYKSVFKKDWVYTYEYNWFTFLKRH